MLRRIITGLLLSGLLFSLQAGEVQHASVKFKNGDYSIDISVKINGDKDTIYKIATDYKKLSRLNDLIIEASLVNQLDKDGKPVIRRRMVTRTCVMSFCFNAILIEDLWEPDSGIIKSVFIPEQSDFSYGEAIWHVLRIDDTHTMITFNSTFKPNFWIPPLIGPLFIKRMMLNETKITINNIEKIAASEKAVP